MVGSGAHGKLTLANKVTILRILSVPVFVLMLLYYTIGLARGEPKEIFRAAALVVFTAGALTDALDGYLARSRREVTHLGRILDPLADKALLLSGLVLLTRPSLPALAPHIPIWFTLLAISRDVVLILGAIIIHALVGKVDVTPHLAGKVTTCLQMVTVIWVLIGGAPRPFLVVVILAGVFTLISGGIYLVDGIRQIERAAVAHRHSEQHVHE